MIIEPIYINNYEVITPLYDQFKDTSVKFYKTAYLISEDYYTPAITQTISDNITYYNYPQMPVLKSGNNSLIFPINFDYSKYRLLDEEVERQDNGSRMLIVRQTWGYTPDIVFSQPATVSWQKPGLYDSENSGVARPFLKNATSDEATRTHTIYVDNSDSFFAPGNLVRVKKDYYALGNSWYYAQRGDYVNIQSVEASSIVIPFFKSTIVYQDGTIGPTVESTDVQNSPLFVSGRKTLQQAANVRSPLAGDYPCEIRSSFVTINTSEDMINIQPAWTPELGGQPTDTLSNVTIPTLQEYTEKIGTSERVLATPETLTQLVGNVYIRQGNYVKYQ